ncbi:type i restriction enzyme ecoki r protein [Anaeramoeba flamelloides]|uniref:Type i restriction enzyme ecoki r protein n=1 Tax=Anaeramoeba flamelloides TaxID=1746091 RepID=A0ABQ8YW11_9EUKA|nr:type i restriction enzyme ecoki r protein [Anaeramoeba flamelloides]
MKVALTWLLLMKHIISPSATWQMVSDHFHSATKIYLTATPERQDGKKIYDNFEEPSYCYTFQQAIEDQVIRDVKFEFVETTKCLEKKLSTKLLQEHDLLVKNGIELKSKALIFTKLSIKNDLSEASDTFNKEWEKLGATHSEIVIQICCVSVLEGLDYPISNINYGGNGAQWDGDTEYFYYDNDSARSGVCENDASSWFVSEISRKTYISFYWKVSSESGYDFLRFYIDDVFQNEISGEVDWTEMSYNIEKENSTSLKWEYSKDGSGSSGMDCGWVDKLVIEDQSVPSITLNEALDNDNLDFTTGDIYTWYGQEEDSYYGGSAVSSSLCKYNSEDSEMSTTFEGYGKFSFYWRAICENGMCQTAFNIDGSSKNIIFGQQESWEQVIYYNLKEGVREITWGYGLMMDSDNYDNYCVLDKVQFEQYKDISLNEALDNQDAVLSTEGDNNWYGQDEISMDGNSAARSGNIKESQTSEMHALVNGKGFVSFSWKFEPVEDYDSLKFKINGETQDYISDPMDWTKASYNIETDGEHKLTWLFSKSTTKSSMDQGFAWVDQLVFPDESMVDEVSLANNIYPYSFPFLLFISLFFFLFFY